MYFFARFAGIVTIVVGVLLMLFGFGAALYGFIQNDTLVSLVNASWLAGSNSRLLDARFYLDMLGLGLFLTGMLTSGLGQLMMVFVDVANNTKETNNILRNMNLTQ